MSVFMPGIADEYRTIASTVGWNDRPGRGRIRLEGADAGSFLQALLTNDVVRLTPGQGMYATYLTPHGRMLADLEVLRRPDAWILSTAPGRAAMIAERLDQSIFSEDVRVTDESAALAEVVVVGAGAAEALAGVLSIAADRLAALPELGQVEWADGFVNLGGDALVPIFHVVTPTAAHASLVRRLESAGLPEISDALLEALRIEAGRPRFGADMTEETIPLEAGLLDRAISTSKGCYVGQEIIIRILHRGGGRVAKRLVTLTFDRLAAGPPPAGTLLMSGDKSIGHLTSVSESPTSAMLIALGYVLRDLAEAGQEVIVSGSGVTATVTGLAG